ncbi:MAG: type II toxin-antitoxin system RelE/ParE family toxin [Luteolibacter sp.]
MNWLVEFRPEVYEDVTIAADWYEQREPGLGSDFVEEIIQTWEEIGKNPWLGSKRHARLEVRWRYPHRFPYRVIYKIDETKQMVLLITVLHAARDERNWLKRVE